jgi:hypothetical protein
MKEGMEKGQKRGWERGKLGEGSKKERMVLKMEVWEKETQKLC